MAIHPNIGPHAGVAGDRTGIGDHMAALDADGIPFSVKSVNDVGLAIEAARYAVSSGVPHNIILRFTNPGGRHDDHPDLSLPPDLAAREIADAVLRSLASDPDIRDYRRYIRIQPTNEISTKDNDPSWIGWYLYHLGVILNEAGWACALGGFNAGQPEPEDWETEGMAALLTYVSANPQNTISVHEAKIDSDGDRNGSLTIDDHPEAFVPHTIGRFQYLLDACDNLGIRRVGIDIDEWAWSYNDIPDRDTVMRDLRWLGDFLSSFPEVRGVYLWNFAGGEQWGNLPHEINYLINPADGAPLTAFILETEYPDPDPRPEPDPDPSPCRGTPREQYHRVYQLCHDSLTLDQARRVFQAGIKDRRTTGFSWDDAGIGDLDRRTVIAVGFPQEEQEETLDWFAEHYLGADLDFREAPD